MFGGALLACAVIRVSAGCGEGYESPCHVTSSRPLFEDPSIPSLPSIAVSRSKDRAVAIWLRREIADAGADAAVGTPTPPELREVDVAVVDERGALGFHTKLEAPPDLRTRQDSLESIGVLVEDGALALHWIETETTTNPDGRLRKSAKTKIAYAAGADTSRPSIPAGVPFAPAQAACAKCLLSVASVSLPTESIFFLRVDQDVADFPAIGVPLAPPAPSFVTLRVRRDGTVIDETGDATWLALPAKIAEAGIASTTARTDRDLDAYLDGLGRIVVTSGGYAWLADVTLRRLAGPIELPSKANDVKVQWNASAAAVVAWSVSPFDEGRSANESIPREIFTGNVALGNGVAGTRERTSRGRVVLGMDRRGTDDVGVYFESAGRNFFARVDGTGKKRGGDLLVATSAARPSSEYGLPALTEASLVFAEQPGTASSYRIVTIGAGKITSSEITCE